MTHRGKRHARAPLVALAILSAMPAAGQVVNEVRVTDSFYRLENTVFVSSDSFQDEILVVVPVYRRATATTTVVQSADLDVDKSAAPPVVEMDDLITYTVTATNLGPSSAVDLVISDPLPLTTVYVSSTPSAGGNCMTPAVDSNGTVTCTWLGATLSTEARSVEIVARFTSALTDPIDNSATASSEISDPISENNSATATTTVVQSADLSVEKSAAPPVVEMDDLITYTVTATNLGPSSAVDLVISDLLPLTTVYVSSTPSAGGTCMTPAVDSNGTVTCTWLGATLSTQARSVEIVARFISELTDPIDNTATASSEISDPISENNSATATTTVVQRADLAVEKSAEPAVVEMNDLVTFTVTTTNLGPSPAVDLVISDPLPPTIVYVSSTPSAGGTCMTPPVDSNGTVVCTWLGDTLATQARSVEIVGRFTGGISDAIVNTATASSEISDPVSANDSATAAVGGLQVAPEIPTLGGAGLVALALGLGALATALLRRASQQRRDL